MKHTNREALVIKMRKATKDQNFARASKIRKQIVRMDMMELNRKALTF